MSGSGKNLKTSGYTLETAMYSGSYRRCTPTRHWLSPCSIRVAFFSPGLWDSFLVLLSAHETQASVCARLCARACAYMREGGEGVGAIKKRLEEDCKTSGSEQTVHSSLEVNIFFIQCYRNFKPPQPNPNQPNSNLNLDLIPQIKTSQFLIFLIVLFSC